MKRRRGPKPFCICGCGRRVNFWHCRYASQSCAEAQRLIDARAGRKAYAQQQRIKLFREELLRLQALDKITGEDLTAAFHRIADRHYHAGYHACWARSRREAA